MTEYDADWTPAGARWYDWVLSGLILVVAVPLVAPVVFFRRLYPKKKSSR